MTEAPPMSSGRVMQAPAGPSLPPAQQAYAEMAMVAVPPRPLRPGFGKEGRPFKLTANWFTLEMRTSEMYQYAVHIKKVALPEAEGGSSRPPRAASGALPALLCRAAMQAMAKEMNWKAGSWAFDGRANMYTADTSVVPNDMVEREVETTLPGEKRPVRFQIKLERSAILPMSLVNDFFKWVTHICCAIVVLDFW